MAATTTILEKLTFPASAGVRLAARLERPRGSVKGYALFAHCFTCGKDVAAATRISRALAEHGHGVLRFDFTGLGSSDGDFENTNFSSNVDDLVAAADYLRSRFAAPQLLVGHSLGGAAVIACADRIPEVRAVATIGAPSEPGHVERLLADAVEPLAHDGRAAVRIAGRTFFVRQGFLDDVRAATLERQLRSSGRAFLFFHSPVDEIVGVESARRLFDAARHPKSFISLDRADHLLSRASDSRYVAAVLSSWVERYLDSPPTRETTPPETTPPETTPPETTPPRRAAAGTVIVEETGTGRFSQRILTPEHELAADEPRRLGGDDSGPNPYELLVASLGACTTMTLRMYANRKNIPLARARVTLRHEKVHADDCADCETRVGKVDSITREIELSGELTREQRERLLEIADKCPVHRTLHSEVVVRTRLSDPGPVV